MREVERLIKKWKSRLFLHEWRFEIKEEESDAPSENGETVLATINACPVYLQGFIRIYPAWKKEKKESRENAVVHELCHCISQEVLELLSLQAQGKFVSQAQGIDAIERLTQRIANVALRAK